MIRLHSMYIFQLGLTVPIITLDTCPMTGSSELRPDASNCFMTYCFSVHLNKPFFINPSFLKLEKLREKWLKTFNRRYRLQ